MIQAEKYLKRWYYRPWAVIALIFFLLGPLGLPLVFKSPFFSRRYKILVTALTIVFFTGLTLVSIESIQAVIRAYGGAAFNPSPV